MKYSILWIGFMEYYRQKLIQGHLNKAAQKDISYKLGFNEVNMRINYRL